MGVAKSLLLFVRHPAWFRTGLRYAIATASEDPSSELKALRRLRAHARILRFRPDYQLQARAAEAKLHLNCGDPSRARKELLEVFKKCKDRSDDVGHQVNLFCRYWISVIDVDPFQADYWSRRVRELGLVNRGFTKLPAPLESNDEYDEEMRKIEAELEKEFASAFTTSNRQLR